MAKGKRLNDNAIRHTVWSLQQIETGTPDKEAAHRQADEVLLQCLRMSGLADVAEAYEGMRTRRGGFWYA